MILLTKRNVFSFTTKNFKNKNRVKKNIEDAIFNLQGAPKSKNQLICLTKVKSKKNKKAFETLTYIG